jgi:uncharacterized repeat protein (TIGR03833 family)
MLSIEGIFDLITETEHFFRNNIKPGMTVDIVLKKDQPTGILTRGVVKKVLSPGNKHTRGIKVMLKDNQVGRVQKIIKNVPYSD